MQNITCNQQKKVNGEFIQAKKRFYIGTLIRGHDKILVEDPDLVRLFLSYEKQLGILDTPKPIHFVIYELGFPESKDLDLINLQQHDTIAGPFEDYQTALNVLPYVIKVRYVREQN